MYEWPAQSYRTNQAVLLCLDAVGSCRCWLTDEQYERIDHLLPEVEGRGCPYNDHRKVTGGIFWTRAFGSTLAGYA
jgi:hypothetical protein